MLDVNRGQSCTIVLMVCFDAGWQGSQNAQGFSINEDSVRNLEPAVPSLDASLVQSVSMFIGESAHLSECSRLVR